MSLTIHPFFELSSGSYSFIVANPQAGCCAIIDPALGVSHAEEGGVDCVNTDTADLMLDWVNAHGFVVRWILDTHIHADRPSATGYLKSRLLCAQTAIGAKTPDVEGYDQLLAEGDKLCLGSTCGRVLETPGHTPGCVSYQFENSVFVGDTLFMPDTGTARCDFPGGCATRLYKSIQRILSLPQDTRLFVCHDYGGQNHRRYRYVTTVAEEKAQNIHVGAQARVEEFVAQRTARDKTLDAPQWAAFSIPANLKCMAVPGIETLMSQSASGRH
jgi:glyoxylase-like metal-dependent hydrolase (beta-lactamase superfamily II)